MIQVLREWVIGICIIVIFISAVELILPNNDMRKYAKFVLGLLLMTVMIKPILGLFDTNFNIDEYARKASAYFDSSKSELDYEKYRDSNIQNTMKVFRRNIEIECEKQLKDEFENNDFKVEADVEYQNEEGEIEISRLNIGVMKKEVSKVKKVIINSKSVSSQKEQVTDRLKKDIQKVVTKELGVSRDNIEVYYINN